MFFDIKIAMLTCSLCRNKALWFFSHCNLRDKGIKLALTSCTRDLCIVSAKILCCDRSFEMPLSHKTFFFSCSEDTENLLVIQTKYHSSFLFIFPSFCVVFLSLSFHFLTSFFLKNFWNRLLISGKCIWMLCQLVPKTYEMAMPC